MTDRTNRHNSTKWEELGRARVSMDSGGVGEFLVVGEVGSSMGEIWKEEMCWGVGGGKGRCGKMCWGCGKVWKVRWVWGVWESMGRCGKGMWGYPGKQASMGRRLVSQSGTPTLLTQPQLP